MLWIFFLLLFSALLIPAALHYPFWVEVELVVVAWWLIWTIVLTRLLYLKAEVSHDHTMASPRSWISRATMSEVVEAGVNRSWVTGADGEGCLMALGLVLAATLLWLTVEIVLPGVVFVVYFAVRGMLAHIANDPHHCHDNWRAALVFGGFWATVYTAPIGLVAWLVHKTL